MSLTPSNTNRQCQSCGTELHGKFCHVCGEKALGPEDKSARKWLSTVFADLSMVDGKLFRTLKGLLFSPGRLAKDYAVGRRVKYLKPLNLFLMANLVYFLIPTFDTFTTRLYTQMRGLPYSPLVERTMEGK